MEFNSSLPLQEEKHRQDEQKSFVIMLFPYISCFLTFDKLFNGMYEFFFLQTVGK